MRIRFITPYFPPEVGAAQTRIHELAVRLERMGYEVSVLTTFPNYPSGIVPQQWRGRFFHKQLDNGIRTYRIWSYATPNRGFLKRITAHLSFALMASLAGLFLPACDINIVESPPLFDGFVGVLLSLVRRTPYVFTVSDLWPESAIQMGALKNFWLIALSKRIERLFYRRSAAVLALTAGIQRAIVASGVEPNKVPLFRNSVDCNFFCPGRNGGRMRRDIGVAESEFVAVYAGTFGLAQNLSTVLDAAELFQTAGNRNVRFVLVGDGAQATMLQQKARALHLQNVTFVPAVAKERMPGLINAADCILVPLRDLAIFRGALPTKLFEAMACAKPVIVGIAGEAAELVGAAAAGHCIAPEDPAAMRDSILALMDSPERAGRMGASGRQYILRHFSREARALELSQILQHIAARQRGGAGLLTMSSGEIRD